MVVVFIKPYSLVYLEGTVCGAEIVQRKTTTGLVLNGDKRGNKSDMD